MTRRRHGGPPGDSGESPINERNGNGLSASRVVARLDDLWRDERVVSETLSDPIGGRVGKYQIVRVLGRGSFGVVYQATDEQLVRTVALKLPRPEVLVDSEKLERFEGEALAAAALDHPLIVPLLEANFEGPTPYIASAFCPGPDLGVWLAQQKEPIPAHEAAEFVSLLASATHYAHETGVFHRDLKPSNVLLDPIEDNADDRLGDYRPRLTDFGLAKLAEASLQDTRSSLLIGSPLYMAPEQLSLTSNRTSPATDVYSLGVLLFELLTLQTPVAGDSYVEVIDNLRQQLPKSLRSVDQRLPRDLDTICEKCLASDPRERYPSARALEEDLRRFGAGEPLVAKPRTWRDHFLRWIKRPERVIQAGWFAVLFQVLSCVWMYLSCLADVLIGVLPDGVSASMWRDGLSITVGNIAIGSLGWLVARGSRWAFWPAIAMTTLMAVFVIYNSLFSSAVFPELYPTLHSRVSVYTGLFLGFAIEAVLFWVAIPAWLRGRRP